MTGRSLVPSIEAVRLLGSATEATVSDLRPAGEYTKRGKVLKFECCRQGEADPLLSQRGLRLTASTGKGRADAIIRESTPEAYEV
ncbi:MAG: hypothetical protein JRN09_00990 [Nitrososphaerota archaeon]|nr:hypothetical protein [Nitrososphaerota archaeon]